MFSLIFSENNHSFHEWALSHSMRTLRQKHYRWKRGLLNFVVVDQARMTSNSWQNPRWNVGRSLIESGWDCGGQSSSRDSVVFNLNDHYQQDGNRVGSQLTINEIVWQYKKVCLKSFNYNLDELFNQFIIVNQTWIQFNKRTTKLQSK